MGKRVLVVLLLAGLCVGSLWADGDADKPKSAALPVVLNIVPGLGIGSFVQKDALGGFVGLAGEIVGVGLVGYGFVYIVVQAVGIGLAEALTLGFAETAEPDMTVAATCVLGGLGLWGGVKIFEIIRPIWVAARYNAGLRAESTAVAGGVSPRVGLLLDTREVGGSFTVRPGLALSLRY